MVTQEYTPGRARGLLQCWQGLRHALLSRRTRWYAGMMGLACKLLGGIGGSILRASRTRPRAVSGPGNGISGIGWDRVSEPDRGQFPASTASASASARRCSVRIASKDAGLTRRRDGLGNRSATSAGKKRVTGVTG